MENLVVQLGELDIANIHLDPRSRDDIPQLLRGLQYLYTDKELREKIFEVLAKLTPESVNPETGRPGMGGWKILIMGSLRLNLNCDYDRLQELVNNKTEQRKIWRLRFIPSFVEFRQIISQDLINDRCLIKEEYAIFASNLILSLIKNTGTDL